MLSRGGAWLMLRTNGVSFARRSAQSNKTYGHCLSHICFLGAGTWLYFGGIEGYTLVTPFDTNGVANSFSKRSLDQCQHSSDERLLDLPNYHDCAIRRYLGGLIVVLRHKTKRALAS